MQEIFREISDAIIGSKKILLSGHRKPDGDCLGSMLALKLSMEKSGKKADIFCSSEIPNFLRFLPQANCLKNKIEEDYDLVLGLDYGDLKRLDTVVCGLPVSLPEITFDHHPLKNQSGRFVAIDQKASSTCEIIFDFLFSQNSEIDRQIATCLLTGIFADTGSFRHPNVTAKTLKAVAQLLSAGAILNKIAKFYSEKNIDSKSKITALALSKMALDESGFIYCLITYDDFRECGAERDDLIGFPAFLCSVSGIRFSLVLREVFPGKWDASFRSFPGGEDVLKYAVALGGGGHRFSCGVRLNEPPEFFIGKLKSLIQGQKSVKIADKIA
ncbi:MAG: bifunctional oligoribonuclease/PAP phosphatase NrnA [Candidatus Portnoybacteria bacterium]|nr:bifunctional oligoribonuclease/PAP phosphatase NrnA [Candidatus Portnoybacteria bacterium]